MVEIIKSFKQNLEAQRFIGKKYDNANRLNGTFEVKTNWDEWFKNGWFEAIKTQVRKNPNNTREDGDVCVALNRNKSGEPFQYWIGMFTPANTEVPNGFDYVDFPKSEIGVCRVYGKAEKIYMNEDISIMDKCNDKLKEEGMNHVHDEIHVCWAFERYPCSRFPTSDEEGNGILDCCFFMKFEKS